MERGYFVLRKPVTGVTATRQDRQVQKVKGQRMAGAKGPSALGVNSTLARFFGSGSSHSQRAERPCCGISSRF